jgi:ADP-heptose:LPS heptosyltransferase
MRILFITSNRIGDAVLSTGLLDALIAEIGKIAADAES